MGFTERSDFYGVQGGSMKNQYIAQKGRLWHFVDLRGAWQERGGRWFWEGGWYPNAHYDQTELYKYCIITAGSNTKISKIQIIEQNVVISLSVLPSAYCDLRLLHLPQQQRFSVLGHSTPQILNVTSDHCAIYSFVFWFENGFIQVKPT